MDCEKKIKHETERYFLAAELDEKKLTINVEMNGKKYGEVFRES